MDCLGDLYAWPRRLLCSQSRFTGLPCGSPPKRSRPRSTTPWGSGTAGRACVGATDQICPGRRTISPGSTSVGALLRGLRRGDCTRVRLRSIGVAGAPVRPEFHGSRAVAGSGHVLVREGRPAPYRVLDGREPTLNDHSIQGFSVDMKATRKRRWGAAAGAQHGTERDDGQGLRESPAKDFGPRQARGRRELMRSGTR